jgi:hypothetical protein
MTPRGSAPSPACWHPHQLSSRRGRRVEGTHVRPWIGHQRSVRLKGAFPSRRPGNPATAKRIDVARRPSPESKQPAARRACRRAGRSSRHAGRLLSAGHDPASNRASAARGSAYRATASPGAVRLRPSRSASGPPPNLSTVDSGWPADIGICLHGAIAFSWSRQNAAKWVSRRAP